MGAGLGVAHGLLGQGRRLHELHGSCRSPPAEGTAVTGQPRAVRPRLRRALEPVQSA